MNQDNGPKDNNTVSDYRERDDKVAYNASGWTEIGGAEGFITPLSELVGKEERGSQEFETLQAEEVRRIRIETISMLCRAAIGDPNREPDAIQTGLNVLVWGWDLQLPPLDKMSQTDIGNLVLQGRAAICERHKKALKKKGKTGARKSNREKSGSLRENLAKKARGNSNRATATAAATLKTGYSKP